MTSGESVVVDALGNAYVTGGFISPTITFGPFTLTNAGVYQYFSCEIRCRWKCVCGQ